MSWTSVVARGALVAGGNDSRPVVSSASSRLSIPTLLLTTGSLLLPTPPEGTTG